ncbi:MAG: ABC transporter permease [Patescibacteria group bacterium]|nr:ABC transporter permease [Patescibacteria group bacterium]
MKLLELYRYRELIKHLVLREIKGRYKQSFIGFFWILLNPLFQMLIMSFVFSFVIRTGQLSVPFPIFVFVGLLPWTLFSNSLSSGVNILVDNASLIRKIYFPREILLIATLIAKLVDFAIASMIFIAMMLYYQIPFTWYMLLFVPILLVQTVFTFGLALVLSALNLLYRDVQYMFQLILSLWFYLTPIVYSVDFFPEQYRWIFQINPMSVFINAYRQVLLGGDVFNIPAILLGGGIALVMFFISYGLFKKMEGIVADVV